jgi:hypothetical protein
MKHLVVACAALLALAGGAQAEQFYKWKDANGVWHYATKPPKDQETQQIHVSGKDTRQSTTAEPTAPAATAAADAAAKPAAGDPPLSAEIAKAQQAQRQANCEAARANVATLEAFQQVRADKDGDGNAEMLSGADHAAELARARTQAQEFCASS